MENIKIKCVYKFIHYFYTTLFTSYESNKTKQHNTKQNKTKQNKTKQNKTKQNDREEKQKNKIKSHQTALLKILLFLLTALIEHSILLSFNTSTTPVK